MFGVYPDDEMDEIKKVRQVREAADIGLYEKLAPKIQGFGVEFPL